MYTIGKHHINSYQLLLPYKISVVLLFLISLNPIYFWNIPTVVISLFCATISIMFLLSNAGNGWFSVHRNIPSILLLLIALLATSRGLNAFGLINRVLITFSFISIFSLKEEMKIHLFEFVIKCYAAIILVSLCFYCLRYLAGVNLPRSYIMYNNINQYACYNYRFFLTLTYLDYTLLPRFQSIFLEPGHLGMISAMILYTTSYSLKKWYNVVLLICSLLTFSLASYVLLLIGVALKYVSKVKTAIIGLIVGAIGLLSLYQIATTYNDGDNILNNKIFMRLVIKDGEMAGNNRTTEDFDIEFKRSIENPANLLFGRDFDADRFGWGNTSYATFIYTFGLLGLLCVILLYFSFVQGYESQYYLKLLLLYTISFIQRPYALWTSQLIIFILGLALLTRNNKRNIHNR